MSRWSDRSRGAELPVTAALLLSLLLGVVFAVNVARGYFLGDDCFISFRYAEHLAGGEGLTWNPGERVEGYTDFLWVVLLAGGMRLGLAPEVLSNVLGIASGVGVLVLLLHGAWRDPFAWIAPFALASSRSFTAWCSGGLETMFFTLLALGGVLAYLSERERRRVRVPLSGLLLAVATLTRPEGALFTGVVGASFLIDVLRKRRAPGSLVVWALPWAAVVGTHVLWRHAYYGAWLPNSFYAKVPGLWWDQGARYLGLFLEDYRLWIFLPLALAAAFAGRRGREPLFAALVATYTVYVAAVGGDRFEFRFMVVILPYLYALIGIGLAWLWQASAGRGARLAAVAIAAAFLFTTARGSREAAADDVRRGIAGLGAIESYASRRAEEGRFLRGLVDSGTLPADLVICVGGAGALPYYSKLPTVDRRGINDATIARLPLARRGLVAHERDIPYDYLIRRRVIVFDVLNQLVHDRDILAGQPPWYDHDGHRLPLLSIPVAGRYLIFAAPMGTFPYAGPNGADSGASGH